MPERSFFNDSLALGLPSRDDDVLTAKRLFEDLGRLAEPASGFSPLFDRPLDEAVRGFQRDRGLREDGRIDPGGPTERNIRRDRGELPAEPPFASSELDLSDAVGNGLANDPADIVGVSRALGRLGLFRFDRTREPSPIITRKLVAGIEQFQRDNGLPDTGEIRPGDRVHEALKLAAADTTGVRSSRGRFNFDAVEKSARAREDEIARRRVDEADSGDGRRSGRFRDTLDAAEKSARARQDAMEQREAKEAEDARIAEERFKFSPEELEVFSRRIRKTIEA